MYEFARSRRSIATMIATVMIAAASWFSVRDEMNIPSAINAAPIKIIPTRLDIIIAPTGPTGAPYASPEIPSAAPYALRGMKFTHETRTVPKKRVNAARNFPNIIPQIETGAVSRSCSVRSFFSSENSFIVRSGISMINEKIMK